MKTHSCLSPHRLVDRHKHEKMKHISPAGFLPLCSLFMYVIGILLCALLHRIKASPSTTFHTYVEERVPVHDCASQRQLSCFIVLSRERSPHNTDTVSAGYLLYATSWRPIKHGFQGQPSIPVVPSNATREGVASIDLIQIRTVARTLLTSLTRALYPSPSPSPSSKSNFNFSALPVTADELCRVTEADIVRAVSHAKAVVANCPDTNHPTCFPFYKLKVCVRNDGLLLL